MLIRQIRSLGSLRKKYGVHALLWKAEKPYVFFKAPTYIIGGSDYSLARQGGLILRNIMMVLFFVENINKTVGDLALYLLSTMIMTIQVIRERGDLSGLYYRFKQVCIPPALPASTN
jgi:hypothetical protein